MRKNLISTLACLCLLLSFFNANAQFDPELRLIPSDCELGMTAFLANAPENSATYDWGDGTSQFANWSYVVHTYETPGIYTVTVVNNGITYVGDVSVEECTCPTALDPVAYYGQCSSVSMRVDTYLYSFGEYSVDWEWGDGTTSSSGWGYPTGYHSYAEAGTYEVCGYFTGPGCEDGVNLCTTVEIEFCDEPCYYEPPYFEFDQTTCSYTLGVIEAPEDITWTVNGNEIGTGNWLTGISLEPGDNEVCIDIAPNLDWNCPLGYTECFTINAEETDCGEPSLDYTEVGCGQVEFEFSVPGAEVAITSIDFGNGFVADTAGISLTNTNYYSPLPGEYEVCVTYYYVGSTVLEEACFPIQVEGCPEEYCWMELWGVELECGLVQLTAYSGIEYFEEVEVLWDYGDGTSDAGSSWTEHYYEPGTYQVCAEIWAPYCNEPLFNCFTLLVEGCDGNCEEIVTTSEIECGLMQFEIGSDYSVEFATWDFGDGTIGESQFDETIVIEHQYDQGGSYEVCVNYYSLECGDILSDCFTIWVEGCGSDCEAQLIWWEEECGSFYFEIVGIDDINDIEWFFSDGNIIYTDEPFITHTFLSDGEYEVCPWFWSETCEEEVGDCCVVVTVDCNEECASIDSSVECLAGTFSYTGEYNGVFHQWSVLQYGQEIMTFEGNQTTTIDFPAEGQYSIGVSDALNCNGDIEPFYIEVYAEDCDENCQDIFEEYIECTSGGFYYEGDIDGTAYCWEVWQDGVMLSTYYADVFTEYTFPSGGTYEVGVTNAIDCNGNIGAYFITVEVEDCGECPEIYTEFLECLDGGFYYEGDIDGTSYCWEIWQDGVMLSTYYDESFTQYSFPATGTYQVGITNALNCDGLSESYFITVDVEDCNNSGECGCELAENLLVNGDFESGSTVNSGLGISCSCDVGSVCVGSEPRDKCVNLLWLDDLWDHTYGTPNGNFLIVDGAVGNVWNEQVNVIEGETYTFSFWQMREMSDNSSNNSHQELTVTLDGLILDQYATLGASPQEWTEYCTSFTAWETGLVTIGIDEASGFGFDDWGLDDISFGACGESQTDCPEITVVDLSCEYGLFSFEGEIDESIFGDTYCWEIWNDEGFFTTYFDEQQTDFFFLEAGTYSVTVTNAVLCDEELTIEILVPECGPICNFNVQGYTLECGVVSFVFPDDASEIYVDFGDGTNSAQDDQQTFFHEYTDEGWYTTTISYYSELCDLFFTGILEVYAQPCNENCLFNAYAAPVDCGVIEVILPDDAVEAFIEFGDGVYDYYGGQNYFTHEYEEGGIYTICIEYFSLECEQWFGDCIEVIIEDCEEEECTPVYLSLDADFGNLEEYTELLECILENESGIVWEGLIPFSSFVNEFGVELCLPDGCYNFSITNSDPLVLASLGVALQSLETDEINIDMTLDIFSGTLDVNFGIGQECTIAVNEELAAELLVYPVPAVDVLNVQFESEGWQYEIVDLTGRVVYRKGNSSSLEVVPVNNWSSGMYILRAIKDNSLLTEKFEVKK